jgi:hypothetical protein
MLGYTFYEYQTTIARQINILKNPKRHPRGNNKGNTKTNC